VTVFVKASGGSLVKSYWLNLHLDYFRRLGHDNHRRLSKLYACEEKKSKTSWGAETVDYEKRVSGFVLANPELKSRRLQLKP
jgi:hypothetical protein